MSRPLTDLLPDVAGTQLVAFTLVLARVGGLVAIGPVFSSRAIPARARAVVALALSLALLPVATAGTTVPDAAPEIAVAVVTEVAVGLLFAVAVAAVVAAVHGAAALADTLSGFAFGSLVDPVSGATGSAFAQLYSLFAALVLLLTGGDAMMIAGLARTYDLVPLGGHVDAAAAAALAARSLAQILLVAVQLAAPVVVALFLTDVGFGVVARAVPQMNVLIVGLPAKLLVGFTVTAAALPLVALRVDQTLRESVLDTLRAMAP